MNRRRRELFFITLLGLGAGGCSDSSIAPTNIARIKVGRDEYGKLIKAFDDILISKGLTRFGAAQGLNEAYGREVLYFEYRFHPGDILALLTANDLHAVGDVEIRVYSSVAKEPLMRSELLQRISKVVQEFGAELIER